jgi:hypothetical protein
MPTTEEKPALTLHLVQALDVLWTTQNEIRGLADEAQWIMQDACTSLGMNLRDAAEEVRVRADALARASLGDKVKGIAERLQTIAKKLEEGAACS